LGSLKSAKLNGLTGGFVPAGPMTGGVKILDGVKDMEALRAADITESWLFSVFGLEVGIFIRSQPHFLLSSISTAPKRQPFVLLNLSRISRTSSCSFGFVSTAAVIAKQRIATVATPLSVVWAAMPQT
jgi:hypothetical protein